MARRTAVSTPAELYAGLSSWLGPFDIDVCCAGPGSIAPPLCDHWWIPEDDGLQQPWPGFAWCNPPFGDEGSWVKKAVHEVRFGDALRVVMLVPVKADLAWWPLAMAEVCKVGWIRYRLKFGGYEGTAGFPCCVLVFEHGLTGPPEHYAVTRAGVATPITPLQDAPGL